MAAITPGPFSLLGWVMAQIWQDGTEWAPDGVDACPDIARATTHPEPVEPIRWVDIRKQAGVERYRNGRYRFSGRIKRTYYKPRPESSCRTVVVHQMAVTRKRTSSRWDKVSAHYVIAPDGDILQLFDHTVRLISSNSLDRAPHHAINIEVAGNFEGHDGTGDWWKPDTFGRGRATDRQLLALAECLDHISDSVAAAGKRDNTGGRIELVAPHRVSGRNSKGRPNRPICPGSRVWKAAETWAVEEGIRVPGPGEKYGGLPIGDDWRSDAWRRHIASMA